MSASDAPEPGAERRELARRSGVVAAGTLGSRLLGALRDAVIAASFPLTHTDAFFVAWTIPNTLRGLLGEGGVAAAFIPVFAELDEREGRARAELYFQRFLGAFGAVLLVTSLVGVLTAPFWATVFAAGYRTDGDKFAVTVELTAIVFPYLFFAGTAALLAGVLNTLGRFLVPSFAPALLNVALIAAPFTLVPFAGSLGLAPVASLAIATLVGGALQLAVQLPSLRQVGVRAVPRFDLGDPAVRRSFLLLAPLLFGTGVHQLNIMLSRLLASFLPHGAQSFLYYAQRLVEIPQGMFALAIASAALPSLAKLESRGEHEEAKATLRHGLRLSLFIALPASAALASLAGPIVTVLFGRGEFGAAEVAGTAHALVWLALGVWTVAAVHPIVRMFYAHGDTRTPVLAASLNLVVFLALSLWGMRALAHEAIALATSAASLAQLALLVFVLRRRIGVLGMGEVTGAAVRALAASTVMALAVRLVAALGHWERGGNDPANAAVLALSALVGVTVYAGAARTLGASELGEVLAAVRSRTKTTGSEPT